MTWSVQFGAGFSRSKYLRNDGKTSGLPSAYWTSDGERFSEMASLHQPTRDLGDQLLVREFIGFNTIVAKFRNQVRAHLLVPVLRGGGMQVLVHVGVITPPVRILPDSVSVCVKRIIDELDGRAVSVLREHAGILVIIVHVGGLEGLGDLEDRRNGVRELLALFPIAVGFGGSGGTCL